VIKIEQSVVSQNILMDVSTNCTTKKNKKTPKMFTGIIKELGHIQSVKLLTGGKEFTVACDLASKVQVDQSININGVCHTATGVDDGSFTVQSVEETLRKTNIGALAKGDFVNLEPSLHPEQLLDGHLVQGHVDGTGEITEIKQEGTDWLISVEYDEQFKDLIVGRGSIAIDGISLTVANEKDTTFTVAIIPYTYEHTNLKKRQPGDAVNLEFDILGKYVVRYLQNREGK
jgi:riboflavin synthase